MKNKRLRTLAGQASIAAPVAVFTPPLQPAATAQAPISKKTSPNPLDHCPAQLFLMLLCVRMDFSTLPAYYFFAFLFFPDC